MKILYEIYQTVYTNETLNNIIKFLRKIDKTQMNGIYIHNIIPNNLQPLRALPPKVRRRKARSKPQLPIFGTQLHVENLSREEDRSKPSRPPRLTTKKASPSSVAENSQIKGRRPATLVL